MRFAALVLLLFATACLHRVRSTSALWLSSENQRLFLSADCVPARGPCLPGTPVPAQDYVERRYQSFRESGFLDLDRDMRLRVVAPIMRPGADTPPLIASAVSRAGPDRLNIAVLASSDLLGYETAIYTLSRTRNGLRPALASIEVKAIAGPESELRKTDYLRFGNSPRFFRLYFQLERSGFDHDSALLSADSAAALTEASRHFEKDPAAFCDAKTQKAGPLRCQLCCLTLPRGVVMIPELAIRVRDQVVYVPLESSLNDVLRAAGEPNPSRLIRTVRISRRVGARQIPIRFNRNSDEVLGLPVAGGDRISW